MAPKSCSAFLLPPHPLPTPHQLYQNVGAPSQPRCKAVSSSTASRGRAPRRLTCSFLLLTGDKNTEFHVQQQQLQRKALLCSARRSEGSWDQEGDVGPIFPSWRCSAELRLPGQGCKLLDAEGEEWDGAPSVSDLLTASLDLM